MERSNQEGQKINKKSQVAGKGGQLGNVNVGDNKKPPTHPCEQEAEKNPNFNQTDSEKGNMGTLWKKMQIITIIKKSNYYEITMTFHSKLAFCHGTHFLQENFK